MSWNYRVMVQEHEDEIYFQVHEVYYNEDGVPESYTEKPISIGSDTIEGFEWVIEKIQEGIKKPVLWYGDDKFPKEYKP